MKNENELREGFWNQLREEDPQLFSKKVSGSQNSQVTDIRIKWNEYLENAHQSGEILDATLKSATL